MAAALSRLLPRLLPWLDGDRGPLLAPLRRASGDALSVCGAQLALQHGAALPGGGGIGFTPRLRANVRLLREAQLLLARLSQQGQAVGAAGDWLLEHIDSLEAQTRVVRDGLPRRYYRSLPVLAGTPLAGTPRVLGLAWRFVELGDSRFEIGTLSEFLKGYQSQGVDSELSLGELWALPTTLRVVLIENLRRLVERVVSEAAARQAAEQLLLHASPVAPAFARQQARGVARSFALQLMQGLHGMQGAVVEAGHRERLRAALAHALPDPAASQRAQQIQESADAHSVAQAISALRALDSADWRSLVSARSATLQTLLQAPVFAAEHETTQDLNLHALERLARRSQQRESAVAARVLQLLQAAPDGAATAPGFWLLGEGRSTLWGHLGLSCARLHVQRLARQAALPLYLLGLLAGSLALAVALLPASAWGWAGGLALLLALLPASEVVTLLAQRLLGEWLPPRHAPRLALEQGIPQAQRVLVVLPAMLHDASSALGLCRSLALHHLANREPEAQFALLTDFDDAPLATLPEDAALLDSASKAIDALEALYPPPPGSARRFLLLHRPRRWCETEQAWIGWERKRGKLEELVALLACGSGSPFIDLGARSQPRAQTALLLTLDADTQLPAGTLRALVGVAAHPLNQPRLDATRRRVIAGHGILQPRIDASWPTSSQVTAFHRLFAGSVGCDPYHAASSEAYSDLFGEASFSGKGLLQVAAVHAVLGGRLPEQQVLSHDLVEGLIARCGAVSDVVLAEPAPAHPDAASGRLHRWTRGDWQLLPLLWRPRGVRLGGLGIWKLIDNLRRSLVAPAALLLLLLALLGWVPIGAGAALLLGLAALSGGSLLAALIALLPQRRDLAWRHFLRRRAGELLQALAGAVWLLALWPRQAALNLHAIALALWRSAVSRRHLLQWTPSARVGLDGQPSPLQLLAPLLPLGFGAWLFASGEAYGLLAALLALLWAGTPVWVQLAARPRREAAPLLAPDEHAELLALAQATWRFFDEQVGPATQHLPPDNVQTAPETLVAQRSSPTNIGLYLTALACARAFGWLSQDEQLTRITATLDTLDRLPRHRGHVLNWIDIRDLQPLPPAYVSTVDSGNLCLCLLALAGALDAETELDPSGRRLALAQRCREFAQQPDFGFLYDLRRRLLRIGWRVDADVADTGHYDLLASEARLASLWAIAKGDVPASHWASLGRPLQASGFEVGLRSWSGSMFEYLMPPLLLHEPSHSLLGRAARMALAEQRRWGEQQGLPWGVSECAHATVDAAQAYQYGPQGVPRLALRRTPPLERVVAPYATALALPLAPEAALANLRRLGQLGAKGPWGYLEALDFTALRQGREQLLTPVATTMAHHQGMTLLALSNLLLQGRPQRWTMAEPQLAAVASLLHERVPAEVSPVPVPLQTPPPTAAAPPRGSGAWQPGESALPPTALLSNGRYSVALRPNGGGWSRFQGADLSRWRDDALRDEYGHFLFLRRDGGELLSLTQHPAPDPRAVYEARFEAERVVFTATWPDLRVCVSVWVSPDDDLELRRVEVWNTSSRPLAMTLYSAFEVSLSEASADETHPAFANLFVSADWDAQTQGLSLQRLPRREGEPALHAMHAVVHAEPEFAPALAMADRARWRGRLRGSWQPLADFEPADALSGARPTGLDPVAALALELRLPPHGRSELLLATAAAGDAAPLEALLRRCRVQGRQAMPAQGGAAGRWPGAEPPRLGELPLEPADREALQLLCTAMLLLLARPAPALLEAEGEALECPRQALWQRGVSGELPILCLHIGSALGLRSLRQLLQGVQLWAKAGLRCDVVIVNTEARAYLMPLQHELASLRERFQARLGAEPSARLHLWTASELGATEQRSLALLARVRLQLDGRSLERLLAPWRSWHEQAQLQRDAVHRQRLEASAARPALIGLPVGGFKAGGRRYAFEHSAARPTPRPWINVLANPGFGALLSEAGGGCSWAGNSRLLQLTPWGNDPLADLQGELFLLQDRDSGGTWMVGRAVDEAWPCQVAHGAGSTTIRQRLGGIDLVARWCVDAELAVKRVHLSLHNPGHRERRLRVVGQLEWLLGAEQGARRSLHTVCREQSEAPLPLTLLMATQLDPTAGASTGFLALHRLGASHARLEDWSCDRRELFDDAGRRVLPDSLGRQAGSGLDPCAVAAAAWRLGPGESVELQFVIGHAESPAAALALATTALAVPPLIAQGRVRRQWRQLQGGVQVRSPDPLFDALVNHWLLYQVVACRLWARAGFYQAGGAYGFRDQLQDAMALDHAAPGLLREQLLRAAGRQFEQGDVQHWWHPPTGAGVRTHCSDDRLWLPQALLQALRAGHDADLLEARAPFLVGEPLSLQQEDSYTTPQNGDTEGTLYEHAARAIDCSLVVGRHGLPLIGGGDWNDGMNRVGHGGQGESVWLAWLLCPLVDGFTPLALARGDLQRAQRWQAALQGWQRALQGPAWDGGWYRRAFFDDGSALGSVAQAECRIDLIAQAWSVLSNGAPPARQVLAMRATESELARPEAGLLPLLTPPLQRSRPWAGYIQAYPPGVRENGGQYNHAAVWALMAQAQLGEAAIAWRLFRQISPAHRSADAQQGPRYGLEPYAVAADIYTEPPYEGRGGWSWTTGSAAWLHRAALGSLLGLQREGRRLRFTPCLPPDWPGVTLLLRDRGRRLRFWLQGSGAAPAWAAQAEGLPVGRWLDLDLASAGPWAVSETAAPD
jgi:cyclic beta-1,2-glucan synthetase